MVADTAALQKYVESMKALANDSVRAVEKQNLINSALKDSSQVAKDVAQNTNNLDDVMKVYTASTKTATSVAKAFGTTLKNIGITIAVAAGISAIAFGIQLYDKYVTHAYETARDKAAEMSQAHEEAAQKVEDLTQQIEELKAKIDECYNSNTGTIVDKQSFGYLVRQKQYLETNLELAKQLADKNAPAFKPERKGCHDLNDRLK